MAAKRSSNEAFSFPSVFRSRICIAIILVIISIAGWMASIRESSAIPAFARKYNANCAMCHYPVFPRLNSFGLQFRRAGYRTPVEFGKDQDISKVGNFLAGRLRTQLAFTDTKNEIDRTEFRLAELGLIYAGAFTRNFSGWISLKTFNGANSVFTGKLYGVFGSPENFFTIRAGQMPMLVFEGVGGFDRPVLISLNPIYNLPLTAQPGASPLRHTFALQQRGVELAYVHGPGRLLFQASNGLDQLGQTLASTPGGATFPGQFQDRDIDRQKDMLVAYDHILDQIASGFTLLYYNGTTHQTVVNSPVTGGPSRADQAFAFERYGINVNKVFNVPGIGFFELQGGYLRSTDRGPAQPLQGAGGKLQGNAWYVEAQQYITGPELTFVERYSVIDVNEPGRNTTRKDYTIGAVTPIQTNFRLTAEYTYTDHRNTGGLAGITSHLALLEIQGVW